MVVLTIRDGHGHTWVTAHHSIVKARAYRPPASAPLEGPLKYCLVEYRPTQTDCLGNPAGFKRGHREGGKLCSPI